MKSYEELKKDAQVFRGWARWAKRFWLEETLKDLLMRMDKVIEYLEADIRHYEDNDIISGKGLKLSHERILSIIKGKDTP